MKPNHAVRDSKIALAACWVLIIIFLIKRRNAIRE